MPTEIKQKTLAKSVELTGKGLFSGAPVTLKILPADCDSGITFKRTDVEKAAPIPAQIASVSQRERRSALADDKSSVETVEHLMSAISGLGLNNLQIELDGPEVPSMDGSGVDFYKAMADAGIVEQDKVVEPLIIKETICVSEGAASIIASPPVREGLDIVYDMDYSEYPSIGRQLLCFTLGNDDYGEQIAPARTFILDKEAEYLRSQGFGKHLTEKELLVIGPDGPINNSLRFPDECVRHKVCDLIGDLSLLGRPIVGRITAHRSGHALNQKLVKTLLEAEIAEKAPEKSAENKPQKPKEEKPEVDTSAKNPSKPTKTAQPAGEQGEPPMDIRKILRILPHRYPFLMIDRVIELDNAERAVGVKNVTFNEPFFQGHYPGQPVMPGVLVLEAMAQLSGILLSRCLDNTNKVALLISMDKVKIRRAARPGDQLIITAESRQVRSRTGFCNCKSTIDGKLSAEAQIKFMLVDEDAT